MTALEAIPKIGELLTRLIKLSKDREAAALVQQIQQYQLVIQTALTEAERNIAQLERDLADAKAKQQAQHSGPKCPFCLKPSGQLLGFVPHEIPDMAEIGLKQKHYSCSSCGKEWRTKNEA